MSSPTALLIVVLSLSSFGSYATVPRDNDVSSSYHLSPQQLLSQVSAWFEEGIDQTQGRGAQSGNPLELLLSRSLQDFSSTCEAAANAIVVASQGALECSCDAAAFSFSCNTPFPICPNQTETTPTDDILSFLDDSLPTVAPASPDDDTVTVLPRDPNATEFCILANLTATFRSDLSGVATNEVCSSFAGVNRPTGPYREGCLRAKFGIDGDVTSCQGSFANDQGTVETCRACRPCGWQGVALDCHNILPNATSTDCYAMASDGTPDGNQYLFPTGGNGTLTIGDPNAPPYDRDTSGVAPAAVGSTPVTLLGVIAGAAVLLGL